MKLGVLFSGGKDSCLAMHIAKQQGHEIKYLLSIIPEDFDSFMFHKPYIKLLEKQAEMLGIDLLLIKSKEKKEKELMDLKELILSVNEEIDGIIVGGIASNYQGKRIEKICNELNIKLIAPLWDYSPEKVWESLFSNDFKVILTKIACEGIPKEFLGNVINKDSYLELKKLSNKYKFRLDFEGGEAESAVLHMPGFKKEIKILFETLSEGNYRHFLDIKKVY